ncbi:LysR family transcriptional regulator [Alsobacter sp. SYSU M60028]|uniref:LysR family transcriptional regulator n=1 Tax=Alsobacter ponti TaxID=2962936 RepID=A0ABT1LAC0_9HYPH|nr:LysR family transcriptional regulator [Alsobacter ponti]MCP8937700.1 LysR family transcriptional regulator [Alsobacter ponti]
MQPSRALFSPAFLYFSAVADAGSIRGAARRLNVASSAMNRQILLLEEALGVSLFERRGRGLRLTGAGEMLLRHVRDTQRDFEGTLADIDLLRGVKRGRVAVASVESVAGGVLPFLVTSFAERFPGVEVGVTVTGSAAVAAMVEAGEADLGFTFNPPSVRGLSVALRRDLAVGAVVAATHPLAGREAVSLAECLEHPLALPARGLSLRDILDAGLAALGRRPRILAEANSLKFMVALARQGAAVAFMPPMGLADDMRDGSLVFLRLTDSGLPSDRFMMIAAAGRSLKLAPAAFFDHCRQELPGYLPHG